MCRRVTLPYSLKFNIFCPSIKLMWTQYPQLPLLHPDKYTLFACEEYTIPVGAISDVTQPPQHLMQLDPNLSFYPLQGEVYITTANVDCCHGNYCTVYRNINTLSGSAPTEKLWFASCSGPNTALLGRYQREQVQEVE